VISGERRDNTRRPETGRKVADYRQQNDPPSVRDVVDPKSSDTKQFFDDTDINRG